MTPLNLPLAELKLSRQGELVYVWCIVRKKKLVLTPEEWVRQHVIHYLINHKGVPLGLISAEMAIKVNTMSRRCDIVVYSSEGIPAMIIECKAPEIKLTEKVFQQISQYNYELGTDILMVTNGLDHIICRINKDEKKLEFLTDLP